VFAPRNPEILNFKEIVAVDSSVATRNDGRFTIGRARTGKVIQATGKPYDVLSRTGYKNLRDRRDGHASIPHPD